MTSFDRAQAAFDADPGPYVDPAAPCAHCDHRLEDHSWSIESYAMPCDVVGCGCDDFSEYTRDDHDADEGDRIYSERKESGPWDD